MTPATIVWVAPSPPDAEQSRALGEWARTSELALRAPFDEPPPVLHVDPQIAEEVERLLDSARDFVSARDGEGADRSLTAAESILRAHPEAPQSAWLMAEVERARSTRWRRVPPVDADAADRSWARAEALDGGRAAGVGEDAGDRHPPPATLSLDVAPAGTRVWLDGIEAHATVGTAAGSHALVVTWDDAVVWAGWLETPPGSSTAHVAAPEPPPCSADDLRRVRTSGDVVDATGVRCRRWVAAAPGAEPGSLRISTCEEERCPGLVTWRERPPWTSIPLSRRPRGGWPAWATWTLVGTGAAAIIGAGVAIIASGALQSPAAETRFVSGGVRAQ